MQYFNLQKVLIKKTSIYAYNGIVAKQQPKTAMPNLKNGARLIGFVGPLLEFIVLPNILYKLQSRVCLYCFRNF